MNTEKTNEQMFKERINDSNGLKIEGVYTEEDKKKIIINLIKKRDKILEEIKEKNSK